MFVNSQRNGFFISTFDCGNIIKGSFEYGSRFGISTIILTTGSEHEGILQHTIENGGIFTIGDRVYKFEKIHDLFVQLQSEI